MDYYAIAPFAHLNMIKEYNHFMVIAPFLKNQKYFDFYVNRRRERKQVLLDTGAFEKGKSISDKKYIDWISKLRPTRAVIPDDINNVKRSVSRGMKFLRKAEKELPLFHNIDWMAVMHGQSVVDLNYEIATYEIECTSIGIPYMHWRDHPYQRAMLARLLPGTVNIHYLGCSSLNEIRLAPSTVMSVDTSWPWKQVQGNDRLDWKRKFNEERMEKVKQMMDIFSSTCTEENEE